MSMEPREGRALAFLIALVLAAGSGLVAADPDLTEIKAIAAGRTATPPMIDGQCGDACWREAAWASDFMPFKGEQKPKVATRFALRFDDTALYVAVVCEEPLAIAAAGRKGRDSMGIFRDDHVEVFIDPRHDHQRYVHIAVSAAGEIYDERVTDVAWDSTARVAVATASGAWSLEMAVPWRDLGVTPAGNPLLGFNICRNRIEAGELVQWSRTRLGFHEPAYFGHAICSEDRDAILAAEAMLRQGGRQGPIHVTASAEVERAATMSFSATTLALLEKRIADVAAFAVDSRGRERIGVVFEAAKRDAQRLAEVRSGSLGAAAIREAEKAAADRAWRIEDQLWGARLDDLLARVAAGAEAP